MIKSMTGYGRYEEMCGNRKIFAEIKSVNHRFCDVSVRVPKCYGFLEEKLRNEASKYIFRGKIDIFVSVEDFEDNSRKVYADKLLAEQYMQVLCNLRDTFSLKDDISVSLLAGFGDIFKIEREEEDPEEVYNQIKPVFLKAVEEFIGSRKREGEKMYADIAGRTEYMRSLVKKIEERSPQTKIEYQKKLEARIKEILEDHSVDEARILTEAAIFADKIAVDEETVRLRGHFDELMRIIDSQEPVGRRLDFFAQEINREINTIGSKACDINISKIVIDLKAEVEKIREQVQNIE